jgi:hypothetical protein
LTENTNTRNITKNAVTHLDASEKVGLEIRSKETKCVFMSHHQIAEQSYNKKTENKSLKRVAIFKYLGMTVINHNYLHKKANTGECLLPFSSETFVLPSSI